MYHVAESWLESLKYPSRYVSLRALSNGLYPLQETFGFCLGFIQEPEARLGFVLMLSKSRTTGNVWDICIFLRFCPGAP
jgi:hypothetical protein